MMVTRTVHPPAGSNSVIVFLTQPTWNYALFGAMVVAAIALIYNNATREAKYPKYW
jgi:CBS-domain-containing membrane protein